jgi:two-component system LytT family response regulator
MANDNVIRCIVVDDEPLAVKLLADYVEKTDGLALVLKTTHALEALYAVQEGKADLVFLDVQMPELTGMQFIKIIRNSCGVILTTAYSEYAAESYDHEVIDYLMKPVTFERFTQAVQKARKRLVEVPANSVPTVQEADHLFVKTEYRIQKIDFDEILFIEAMRDYIAFHTAAGKVLSLDSMKRMEELLPLNRFIRIHKSYIINKSSIDYIERGRVVINGHYLPIGDTYRPRVAAHIRLA